MAIFGVTRSKPGGAYSLQSIAQQALDPEVDPSTLPVNPFAAVPARTGAAPTTPLPVQQANLPEGYQFTGEFDARNRALQAEESDAGFARTQGIQQIAEAFLKAQGRAEENRTKAQQTLHGSFASRGLLGSGVVLDKDAELSQNYQRYIDDLSGARASDLASIENNYASILNRNARTREGLFSQQQAVEEERRLNEERIRAEAARAEQEATMRRNELAQLVAAQEQARAQMMQAIAASQVTYSPPSFSGGGGGGSTYTPPPPPTPQAEARITLPFLNATSNVPGSAVQSWVKKNIDPNLVGGQLTAVIRALTSAGKNGLTRTELANVIQNSSKFAGVRA